MLFMFNSNYTLFLKGQDERFLKKNLNDSSILPNQIQNHESIHLYKLCFLSDVVLCVILYAHSSIASVDLVSERRNGNNFSTTVWTQNFTHQSYFTCATNRWETTNNINFSQSVWPVLFLPKTKQRWLKN